MYSVSDMEFSESPAFEVETAAKRPLKIGDQVMANSTCQTVTVPSISTAAVLGPERLTTVPVFPLFTVTRLDLMCWHCYCGVEIPSEDYGCPSCKLYGYTKE